MNLSLCFKYLALFSLLVGCAQPKIDYSGDGSLNTIPSDRSLDAQSYQQKINQLEQALIALNATVDKTEAQTVAATAVRESAHLAQEYQLVQPAIAHNMLVVLGIKDRGLCHHWTEDLMKRLQALDLKSLKLHWGVAYRGSHLREHNSVVITAMQQSFFEGIVLDPWRNSGNLYWARLAKDSYPWKVLPPSEW